MVSVGADRDLRINYLFPPERDQDERVDEDDMENPELRNAAKVLAGHTGRDGAYYNSLLLRLYLSSSNSQCPLYHRCWCL